jgi:type I restriction enzyme S subunit
LTAVTLVRLGDVAQYLRGINFKPDDVVPVGTAGTVACMRTKNIQESLDCKDVWGVSENFVRRPEQILKEGDILVSSANSWNLVGKCCWIPKLPWKSTFGGFVSALRADTKQIDPRFLYWWFSLDRTQALLRSFGQKTTSISNLNAERCLNLDVPLPPLPEQRRIAAILDQADALRAKRREALAQLDGLTQSIFMEMFGDPATNPKAWARLTLNELMDENGPQNGLYKPSTDYGTGIPILRIDAFYDGVVTKLDTLKRVRLSESELSLYGLRFEDIVINRVNSIEYLGKSALIPKLNEHTVFESNMMRFTVMRDVVEPGYVVQFLQTKYIKSQIISCSKNAVNQSSINQQDVKSFQVNVPPLTLQQTFATRIQAVETLKATHQVALAELDSLFACLQHRAFRGEL